MEAPVIPPLVHLPVRWKATTLVWSAQLRSTHLNKTQNLYGQQYFFSINTNVSKVQNQTLAKTQLYFSQEYCKLQIHFCSSLVCALQRV